MAIGFRGRPARHIHIIIVNLLRHSTHTHTHFSQYFRIFLNTPNKRTNPITPIHARTHRGGAGKLRKPVRDVFNMSTLIPRRVHALAILKFSSHIKVAYANKQQKLRDTSGQIRSQTTRVCPYNQI